MAPWLESARLLCEAKAAAGAEPRTLDSAEAVGTRAVAMSAALLRRAAAAPPRRRLTVLAASMVVGAFVVV